MRKQVKHILTAILKDRKGNILSIGKNSYIKTHPVMYRLNQELGETDITKIYIHAEIDALIKCSNLDKAHILEVFRIRNNEYRSSKPCPICTHAISKTNIRFLKYMNSEGIFVSEELFKKEKGLLC